MWYHQLIATALNFSKNLFEQFFLDNEKNFFGVETRNYLMKKTPRYCGVKDCR